MKPVLRLDVHHQRALIGQQQVVRDVLADLAVDIGIKQERLGDDVPHLWGEVGEQQPPQFQPRLIDHVVAHVADQYVPE